MLKRLLFALAFVLISVFLLNACSDDDEDVDPSCDCPAATPWGKPGNSDCFASKADCEADLGSGCEICN